MKHSEEGRRGKESRKIEDRGPRKENDSLRS
jgi:hypothetical protein